MNYANPVQLRLIVKSDIQINLNILFKQPKATK